MEEKKQDRRVSRTRRLLARALIDMTLEKGYDAVTIRDITERADVGYATFFRHYPAKDALLVDVLDAFLEELLELATARFSPEDARETGRLIFEHARRNGELYRLLLASQGSSGIVDRIYEVGTREILARVKPRPGADVPPEVAAHHMIASFLSLIAWWLQNDMPYTPEQMGHIYSELIARPAEAAAFESL